MPKIVPPDGPEDAEILILGESAGTQEERFGRPFVGASGYMLFDDWLGRIGITRSDCYILNVYWERPPGNTLEKAKDPWKYAEQTVQAIQAHPRKAILAVGNWALELLTGQDKITSWRGSILRDTTGKFGQSFPGPILPILHPASIMRNYPNRPLCLYDMLRLKKLLADPSLSDIPRNIIHFNRLVQEEGNRILAFDRMYSILESYKDASCLAFDIETYEQTITCIGLARSESDACVVPLTGEWNSEKTTQLLLLLREILDCPMPKIGQNLDYDVQYLAKCYSIPVRNVWMDTMVAHACLQPEMRHTLQVLASIYTLHPYYKDMRKESYSGDPSELRDIYNGTDCTVTFEVAMRLFEDLQHTNRSHLCFDIDMPATKTLVRMEYKGILVDEPAKKQLELDLTEQMEQIASGPDMQGINPNSNPQVSKFLKKNLPPYLAKTVSGTDKHKLAILANKLRGIEKHTAIKDCVLAIIKYRSLSTMCGTFAKAQTGEDGRMHTSFYTWVTSTGRLNSRKTQVGGGKNPFGGGMNLQNVPKSQRIWLIPDPGKIIWQGDASQIEARITAWEAQDESYIQAFLDGRDVHGEHTVAIFKIDEAQVRDKIPGSPYSYRDGGKRATHAIDYRIGSRSLAMYMNEYFPDLSMSSEEAQEFINTFLEMRPGINRFWLQNDEELWNTGTLTNCYGRKRSFLSLRKDQPRTAQESIFKDATAFKPQSGAADYMKLAMVAIESRLRKEVPTANLLIQVHDSVVGQCFPEDLGKIKQIVTEEMERPMPLSWNGHPLIVPADFEAGPTWGDCKEWNIQQ